MAQQTAVEWLESEIKKIRNIIPKSLFEQAKQMEKKQHWKTWMDSTYKYPFDEYYNKTYRNSEIPN